MSGLSTMHTDIPVIQNRMKMEHTYLVQSVWNGLPGKVVFFQTKRFLNYVLFTPYPAFLMKQ